MALALPRTVISNARRVVPKACEAFSTFAEKFQVELHGRYSVPKLEGLLRYSASSLRVAAVVVLTAVPCTLVVILTDLLPLQQPSEGLTGQTFTYWMRVFVCGNVITVATLLQWAHASPKLRVWPVRFALASVVITLATNLMILALHLIVGFPTPFLMQIISPPWQVLVACPSWMLCRNTIRADPELKQDLTRYLVFWMAEVTMINVYPVCSYIFGTLDGQYQTLFSMVLPLWKIVLRNWCSYGSFRREELAPVMVVFNVDVFHALFLASAMRSSSTTGSNTLVVVMAVDFIQSCIAVYEVARVLGTVKALEMQMDDLNGSNTVVCPTSTNAFQRSAAMLKECQRLREHPTIVEPRHRQQIETLSSDQTQQSFFSWGLFPTAKVTASDVGLSLPRPSSSPKTPHLDEIKREYVRANLKVLYMVEFYMLIEFTEVVVTIVYSIYLLAMSQLPNRKFYLPLKHLTGDQFTETVQYVMKYAALEMVSFLLLAAVLSRMLRISTMHQLAFVLERHWLLVQTFLVLWVFFPIQMSLEHLGCDYTFKFAWLHKAAPPPIQ